MSDISASLKSTKKRFNLYNVFFVLILVNFVVLTSVYSLCTPTFEGGDERAFYFYARYAHDGNFSVSPYLKDMPLSFIIYGTFLNFVDQPKDGPQDLVINDKEWPSYENRFYHGIEEAYPFTGVALTVHELRIVSIVCGAVTLIFVYKAAKIIFQSNSWLPLFCMAFISMIPKFAAVSSTIADDDPAWVFSTIALFFLLKYSDDIGKVKNLILCGIFILPAILAKENGILIYPIVFSFFVYLLYSKQINKKSFLKNLAIFSIVPSFGLGRYLLALFQEWQNHLINSTDQISSNTHGIKFAQLDQHNLTERVFEMNWSWLGSHVIQIQQNYLTVAFIMTILACVGLFLVFIKKIPLSDIEIKKNHVMILFSSVAFFLSFMFGWLGFAAGGDIKYTYIIIVVYGILFTIGLYALVDKKYLKILLILPLIFLALLNVGLIEEINFQWYNMINFYKNPFTIMLQVYNSRSDLQNAFPEVKSGNFTNYLLWIQSHGIYEHPYLRKILPLVDLIQIYYSRPDLQHAFPEVKDKHEINNLVKWAIDVGATSQPVLSGYNSYFIKYYQNIK